MVVARTVIAVRSAVRLSSGENTVLLTLRFQRGCDALERVCQRQLTVLVLIHDVVDWLQLANRQRRYAFILPVIGYFDSHL